MNLFEIFGTIGLKGAEEVSKGLSDVDKTAASSEKTLKEAGKSAEGASGGFTKFAESLEKTGSKMKATGESLTLLVTGPIVAAGAAVLKMASDVGNAADRILDLSAITGQSTQAIQEWQYAAKIAGTDVEAMAQGARFLNEQMDAIEKGTGKSAEALEKLGISTETFVAASSDERISMLVESLQGVGDASERAALGSAVFGGEWQKIAPIVSLGAEGLRDAKAASEEFAMNEAELEAANNFRVALAELQAQLGGVYQDLAIALIPAAQAMVDLFESHGIPAIKGLAAVAAELADWFSQLPQPIQAVVLVVAGLAAAAGPVILILGKIVTAAGALGTALPVVTGGFTGLLAVMAPILIKLALLYAAWELLKATIKLFEPELKALGEWLKGLGGPIDFLIKKYEQLIKVVKNFMSLMSDRKVTRELEKDPNDPANQTSGNSGQNTGGSGDSGGVQYKGGRARGDEGYEEDMAARKREQERRRKYSGDGGSGSGGRQYVRMQRGDTNPGGTYIDNRYANFNDGGKNMTDRFARQGAGTIGAFA